jgi:hypothetical protein
MRITRIPIEAELEHADSGQLEFISKRNYVRSDNSEIFGNERQAAQLSPDGLEEISAGPRDPMPGFSGLSLGRNMPCRAKGAEVIKPNEVHMGQQRFQAVNAPAITGLAKGFPIIHRVAPKLAFGAEIIRRHAGYEPWSEISIQLEALGIGPNITRIKRHKERQISDQEHAAAPGILLQAPALAEQHKLRKPSLVQLVRKLVSRVGHSRRTAPEQILRPIEKINASQACLQRPKERMVIEPISLFDTELLEFNMQRRVGIGGNVRP